jgi:hypothetical protein
MKEDHILNNFIILTIMIGLISIYAIGSTTDQSESFLDIDALLTGWESTYGSIKTMRVSYSYQLVDYKPPARDPDCPAPVAYQHVERVEDGKRYHIRYSIAEDGFERPESLMEHAFDGEITREYWGSKNHGIICSGLTGRNVENMNLFKKFTLTESQIAPDYLKEEYPNGITRINLLFRIRKPSAVIRPYLETVAGQPCHVVELTNIKGLQPGSKKDIFWMAQDKGMCLMKYQRYEYNKMDREIEVEQTAMADMDGTAIWYPVKIRRKEIDDLGTITEELTVKQFVPNVKVDENTFRFDFPPDTWVVDRVVGLSYTMSGGEVIGYTTRIKESDPRKEDAIEKTNNDTANMGKTSTETKVTPTAIVTDDQKKKEEGRIPIGSVAKEDKMLGLRILAILGIVVLAALGLLFWYKRSTNS